jgi:hypothetical protein
MIWCGIFWLHNYQKSTIGLGECTIELFISGRFSTYCGCGHCASLSQLTEYKVF